MKEGRGRRSEWLITLPQPGKFESLEEYNIQNGDIIEYLTLEWRSFIGVLRIKIVRKPRTPLSQLGVCLVKGRESKSEVRSPANLTSLA